jgi:hypothetical protein
LRTDVRADPALLGIALAAGHTVLERVEAETQSRRLRLASEGLPSLSYQLVCCWHRAIRFLCKQKAGAVPSDPSERVFRPLQLTHDWRCRAPTHKDSHATWGCQLQVSIRETEAYEYIPDEAMA